MQGRVTACIVVGVGLLEVTSWGHHFLSVSPWPKYLTSWFFSLHACKMGIDKTYFRELLGGLLIHVKCCIEYFAHSNII